MRRRKPEQLDLLSWQPPRAVIAFPLASRLGKARAVARLLQSRKTEEGREAAWNKVCEQLWSELEGRGYPADEIKAELHRFYLLCDKLMLPDADRREG